MLRDEPPTMATVQVALSDAGAEVRLSGTIVLDYAQAIREQLRAVVLGGRLHVLVDFSEVTEVDSRGLAALVSLVKLARERGGAVRCHSAPPHVYEIFELTRLHRVFDFFPDRSSALSRPWEDSAISRG